MLFSLLKVQINNYKIQAKVIITLLADSVKDDEFVI